MGHTPETRARETAKRKSIRAEWFSANGPCRECGSPERLELDHKDPEHKVGHTVWSWSPARRTAELEKCQVLCYRCHKKKTALQMSAKSTGRVVKSIRKISDKDILKAVLMRKTGKTVRAIAKRFNVSHVTITRLTNAAMNQKVFKSRGVLLGT